jgi:hypothetical protein
VELKTVGGENLREACAYQPVGMIGIAHIADRDGVDRYYGHRRPGHEQANRAEKKERSKAAIHLWSPEGVASVIVYEEAKEKGADVAPAMAEHKRSVSFASRAVVGIRVITLKRLWHGLVPLPNKKADVAEHPEAFDHVGLLVNWPPYIAGVPFS